MHGGKRSGEEALWKMVFRAPMPVFLSSILQVGRNNQER